MKLINADTLDDYLGKWADDFYENPENSDADFMDGYCMTMNRIQSSAVPTVDAVPVSYIQQRIDRLKILAEYEAEANGGYVGKVHTEVYALRALINYWKAEQSAKDK